MEFHASLLDQIESVVDYEIGEQLYLNVEGGTPLVLIAYIIYSTHTEYVVRSPEGVMQLEGTSLCRTPRIV